MVISMYSASQGEHSGKERERRRREFHCTLLLKENILGERESKTNKERDERIY